MNSYPFNLNGPDFLVFYAIFGVTLLVLYYFVRYFNETGNIDLISLTDPYLFAYLRGGPNEVIRIITISLVERGYLSVRQDTLEINKYPNTDDELTPLETEVLVFYRNRIKATEIFQKTNFAKYCEPYQKELEKHNLLPDAQNPYDTKNRVLYNCPFVIWNRNL